ncbi:LCI fold-containing protein [Bacillus cereus group sp. TH150LC]|uniref:LCI fold-containing protein n=1 Tax=Bacillus cereus group sp. TH150LC TaxID=3018061 RepID=UPI0022E1FB00|nr:LCI fold-containing protein [Bacillus cereus group sp. TH150LC]MDA1657922.1 LCI family antimicrobial peptide [Bacillus cereus group sp. TH150LC]
MFKKLVVGALATGIALTGGIGAASASTENTASALSTQCKNTEARETQKGSGIYYKFECKSQNVFANSYTDNQGITWYLKDIQVVGGKYEAYYEGRKY